jgi:hypothetical protein
VLAGIDPLGDELEIDWYRIGAEALLEMQLQPGDWRISEGKKEPEGMNTAWAILFLRRAAPPIVGDPKLRAPKREPENPTTNRPKPKPKEDPKEDPATPITGDDKK